MLAGGDNRVWHRKDLDVAHAGPHSWCKLVHVETVGRLLEAVDRRELSPVMHLPDELELRGLGQTGEHDFQVDIVGDFPPPAL